MNIKYFFLFLFFSSVKSFIPRHSLKMFTNQEINTIIKHKNILETLDYTKLNRLIENKDLLNVYVDNKHNDIYSSDVFDPLHLHLTHIDPYISETFIDKIVEKEIPLYFVENNSFNPTVFFNFLLSSLNIIIPLAFLSFVFSRMNPNPNGNFLNTKKKEDIFEKPNVSLSQWAGSEEIIEECRDVIDYIQNQKIYEAFQAKMPKGILLNGPPGTGKTMLAKAIASETECNFISVSGSEFMELYVGLGAARVRELFNNARKNKPCILFIDEIDAIGKRRGNNFNGMNDEREQTLNQLLYEMDGFNNNTDIFIMGATNRKDILDEALLRPGRFDRLLTIPLPDRDSRKKIIELYLKNKKYDYSVDIDLLSDITNGFSGAELNNIINEATISSIKYKDYIIRDTYLLEAFEKSIVGVIKKNSTILPEVSKRVALHETGHTIMALLNPYVNFQKVSILPTYNGAGGYTLFTNKFDNQLYTREEFEYRLRVMLGGRAMEEIFYGIQNISLGGTQDLEEANKLANSMVSKFGMSDYVTLYQPEENLVESEMMKEDRYIGISQILNKCYKETKDTLTEYYGKALEIHELLLEKKTLTKRDIIF